MHQPSNHHLGEYVWVTFSGHRGHANPMFAFGMAYFEGYISFRESIPPTWYTSARGNKHQQGHQDFQVPKMEVLNSYICDYLDCAFKYVLVSPRTSGKISILTNIFHNGLNPPTSQHQ